MEAVRYSTDEMMIYVPKGPYVKEPVEIKQGYYSCPTERIYVESFWIDRTEVSVDDYAQCVNSGKCTMEGIRIDSSCNWGREGFGNHPINCISWHNANDYCIWTGKRLPFEAEWEKASRGNAMYRYPWGDENATCRLAVMNEGKKKSNHGCGADSTWPVDSTLDDISPYGAINMSGNVSEWIFEEVDRCDNDFGKHSNMANKKYHILKGGSWISIDSLSMRPTIRNYSDRTEASMMGFRCAKDAE